MNADHPSRRRFIHHSAGICIGGVIAAPALALQDEPASKPPPTVIAPDARADESIRSVRERNGPALEQQANEYIVLYAHSDIDKVRALLQAQPKLANATMDWGGGDWESALGAASHMGRRDMAELLLAHGARPDIFCAAMMGWLDAVKGMLVANPVLLKTPGPHGIPLIDHAKQGGKEAAAVLTYLESLKP